ncbi:MAG: site-specific DNA-methyltransferase [Firmicutes bacterium]|nr:site-specific DNA-methyltransferase [Bacillota bacterium]
MNIENFRQSLLSYDFSGNPTESGFIETGFGSIACFTNEFWTSGQRRASSIHEVSYRACYKPQLPAFFIKLLTEECDTVYDPFGGRGTTAIEAGLSGRKVISNDVNPLSAVFVKPRLNIPSYGEIEFRLNEISGMPLKEADQDLSMFYHADTLREIATLREYLAKRSFEGSSDSTDDWIRMVATNRLTGHSKGFFSVYSLPPNQAVTPDRQILINKKLNQIPEYRNVKDLILKKTETLFKKLTGQERENLKKAGQTAMLLTGEAHKTEDIPDDTVKLTVTSPPFLDVVDYATDNWLRCWFNSIDTDEVTKKITSIRSPEKWADYMQLVFNELYRITSPGGWVAFEVGEVKKGKIKLEEFVIPIGIKAGFECACVLINSQVFTKTSNIWGINNNSKGTNSNRITIFRKKDRN